MNASEFYALRDSRTNACVARLGYVSRRVAITIGPDVAATYAGQVAFLLAVNLTARWCRCLRIGAAPVGVDPRLARTVGLDAPRLDELAAVMAQRADPFGVFAIGGEGHHAELELHVGAEEAPSSAYCVRGDGWLALGGAAVRERAHGLGVGDNPLGAALAAAVGCAWLFRRAVDEDPHALPQSVVLSLWNLRGATAAVDGPSLHGDLGKVMLVGCGAVGSAIAWLASLTPLTARWLLVDGDTVDPTNLNRSPLFVADDIGAAKCDIVASLLTRVGREVVAVPEWFDDALAARRVFDDRPDVVIPAANDRGVRHGVQHQVPPLQVYGTTGRDWQAFLGRHIPLTEDCLACRFPSNRAAPPLACATAHVLVPDLAEPSVDAALPFLSSAAAIMAVAELAKMVGSGQYPMNGNFACLDFRGRLDDFFVEQRVRAAGCFCLDQQPIWAALNGRTIHVSRSVATP